MKTLRIVFALIFIVSLHLQAQHTNNGASLTIQSGLNVYSLNDFVNNAGGTISNSGTIHQSGNWTNNNVLPFNLNAGTVNLTGAAQTIGGTATTNFFNLTLNGTGVKSLTVNTEVNGVLSLLDKELSTGTRTLSVTSPNAAAAITRTSGFVSSGVGGSLTRTTNSTSSYLFPVGSASPSRYRPVQIKPSNPDGHTYEVRMANVNATTEGFNLANTDGYISGLNTNFYHHIKRTLGVYPADVTINYLAADGAYTGVGYWTANKWNDVGPATFAPGNSLTISNWSNFSQFVLGNSSIATAVPTLSEWGVILLALLSITLVSLFIRSKQMVTEIGYVSVGVSSLIRSAPFSKEGYFKILGIILPLAILGFAIIHILMGTNGALDLIGTIVSTFILAYIVQLYSMMKETTA